MRQALLPLLLLTPLLIAPASAEGGTLADLVPVAVGVEPAEVHVNDTVTYVAVVRNDGAVAAPATTALGYFPTEGFFTLATPALGPGESATLTRSIFVAGESSGSLGLTVDWHATVEESNESNNRLDDLVWVRPLRADVAVRIVSIEKPRVQTDFADAPHPVGRRIITTEVCNENDRSFDEVWHQVIVEGDTLFFEVLRQENIGALPSGACRTFTDVWDPVANVFVDVGDVTITAEVGATWDEVDFSDNVDTRRDFVLVGGLGVGFV